MFFLNNPLLFKKYFFKKENLFKNELISDQKKFTLTYNLSHPSIFLNEVQKEYFKKVYTPRIKVKRKPKESKYIGHEIYDHLMNPKQIYDKKTLKRLIRNFTNKDSLDIFKSNHL